MPKVTVRCNAEPDCRQLRCLYALPIRTRHYQLLGIKGEMPQSRLEGLCALSGLAANSSITAASRASRRLCSRSRSRSARHRSQRKSASRRLVRAAAAAAFGHQRGLAPTAECCAPIQAPLARPGRGPVALDGDFALAPGLGAPVGTGHADGGRNEARRQTTARQRVVYRVCRRNRHVRSSVLCASVSRVLGRWPASPGEPRLAARMRAGGPRPRRGPTPCRVPSRPRPGDRRVTRSHANRLRPCNLPRPHR